MLSTIGLKNKKTSNPILGLKNNIIIKTREKNPPMINKRDVEIIL
jgi:hypothetical protein